MHKLRKLFKRHRTFISELMACIGVLIILYVLMIVPRVEGASAMMILVGTVGGFALMMTIFVFLYLDHKLQQKKRFQALNERLRNPDNNSNLEYHKSDL